MIGICLGNFFDYSLEEEKRYIIKTEIAYNKHCSEKRRFERLFEKTIIIGEVIENGNSN